MSLHVESTDFFRHTWFEGSLHVVLLTDYKRQPLAVRVPHRLATRNALLLSEVSLQFQNLQQDVVGLLVQHQSALTQLKQMPGFACLTTR